MNLTSKHSTPKSRVSPSHSTSLKNCPQFTGVLIEAARSPIRPDDNYSDHFRLDDRRVGSSPLVILVWIARGVFFVYKDRYGLLCNTETKFTSTRLLHAALAEYAPYIGKARYDAALRRVKELGLSNVAGRVQKYNSAWKKELPAKADILR